MTTRYTEEQIGDVARILRAERDAGLAALGKNQGSDAVACAMIDFADLFAADNPAYCINCGAPAITDEVCASAGGRLYDEHLFEGGFDREKFLDACGLEERA